MSEARVISSLPRVVESGSLWGLAKPYVVLIALTALVGCSFRSARPGPHRVSLCGERDVRLTIRPARNSYPIGEPVEVFLRIENISSGPLDLRAVNPSTGEVIGFDYDPIENPRCFLFLQRASGTVELAESSWAEAHGLGAGNAIEKRLRLVPLGEKDAHVLRKPGRYNLVGLYCWGWNAEVRGQTGPITITIASN